ncbi:MAG: OB-fold nucleic acid binding domain-containing protein [Patescibacteria group bacterium]|nr:OB-fold nucleic acid binding domain-containing protein [Patescibacteria group bacterium]
MKHFFISELTEKINQEVKLYGWAQSVRKHKEVIFVDLRDRSGVVQVVITKANQEININQEDVLYIKGKVKNRPGNFVNKNLPTGSIEVEASEVKILNHTRPLPLQVNTSGYEINEEIRLKYRFLDLRRPRLFRNLQFRCRFIQTIREFFLEKGFIEVETPILSEATPEGARDFIVPSRLQPGNFYALPQSPQQYKQLLMVAGIERYFQIARCFRDEDPRADRAYGEFTQLDVEISFVSRDEVMKMIETMIIEVYEKLKIPIKEKPFPIFTYQQTMRKFGADKFDLRTEKEKEKNIQAFAWIIDFPFFKKTNTGWTFTHNPFSSPKPEFMEDLLTKRNINEILTTQYDLVCNGYEVGGGSIRNHHPEALKAVFEIMGLSKDEIESKFGHIIDALGYGAPPHGGIALGIDRLLACVLNEKNVREVIAMPMTSGGKTSVMNAPSPVDEEKLKELGIRISV